MEIYYCKKCRSRVSSYDVTAGKGMMTDDGETYCQSCIRELGLDDLVKKEARKPGKKKSTSTTAIRKTGAHRAVRQTGTHRPVHQTTGMRRPVPGHLPPSQAAQKKSNTGLVLGIVGGIILAIIIAAVVINSGNKQPQTTQTSGTTPIEVGAGGSNQSPVTSNQNANANENTSQQNTENTPPTQRPIADVPKVKDEGEIPEAPERIFTETNGWYSFTGEDWKDYVFSISETLSSSDQQLKTSVSGERMNLSFQTKAAWFDHSVAAVFAVSRRTAVRLTYRSKDGSGGFLFIQDIEPGVWHTLRADIKGETVEKLTLNGKDMKSVREAGILMRLERLGKRGKTGMTFTTRTAGTTDIAVHEFAIKGEAAGIVQNIDLTGLWKFTTQNQEGFKNSAYDDSAWGTAKVPAHFPDNANRVGFAWYRKKVMIPDNAEKARFTIHIQNVDDKEVTYINGVKVGSKDRHGQVRRYAVPDGIIKAGEETLIAVRVENTGGPGGIEQSPVKLIIEYPGTLKPGDVSTAAATIKAPDAVPGTGTLSGPSQDKPILWYNIGVSEDKSKNTLYNSADRSNPGRLTGMPDWVDEGKPQGSLSFNGNGDYVDTEEIPIQNSVSNTFSMVIWVKPESERNLTQKKGDWTGTLDQRYAVFPRHGSNSGKAGAGISVGTNGIGVFEHADAYMPCVAEFNQPVTGWTHVAVVYAQGQPKLYINGELKVTGGISSKQVFPSAQLGGRPSQDYGWYHGLLDDYRVYNRALSAEDVKALANMEEPTSNKLSTSNIQHSTPNDPDGQSSTPPAGPKLLSHWSFDGDSESIFRDAGENDQSGVFYGAQKASGRTGKGVEFDGKSMRAELTKPVPLPAAGTIAFWVKKNTDFKNTGAAVYGGKTFAFLINKDNNIGVYVFPEGTSGLIKSKTAIIPGVWTHIALTYDSSAKKRQLYINGKLDTENAGAMTPPEPMKLIFGSNGPSNKLPFGGGIDEVFLYEGILDANQVVACMLGKSAFGASHQSPVTSNQKTAKSDQSFTGTDVIWIEGENPTSKEGWFKHGWYHAQDVKKELLSGNDWLSHFNMDDPTTPEATYEFNTANSEYSIWVRYNATPQSKEFQFDNGEWKPIISLEGTTIMISKVIDVRFLSWAKVYTGPLSAGKHTIKLRFSQNGSKGAAIDCLCITTDKNWKPDKTASKPAITRGAMEQRTTNDERGTENNAPRQMKPGWLFEEGFEGGHDLEARGYIKTERGGKISKTRERAHSGNSSLESTMGIDGVQASISRKVPAQEFYIRFYLYVASDHWDGFEGQGDQLSFFKVTGTANNGLYFMSLRFWKTTWGSDGFLTIIPDRFQGEYPSVAGQAKFPTGKWTCVEIKVPRPDKDSEMVLWVNNQEIGRKKTDMTHMGTWDSFSLGFPDKKPGKTTPHIFIDDVVISQKKIGLSGK